MILDDKSIDKEDITFGYIFNSPGNHSITIKLDKNLTTMKEMFKE